EDAIDPGELSLHVERLGVAPLVRTVRIAHWMEALLEVLVFIASAEDEHRRGLPELRRGQRDIVVGKISILLARGLRPLRRREGVGRDASVHRVHEAVADEAGAELHPVLEPRRLAISPAEG